MMKQLLTLLALLLGLSFSAFGQAQSKLPPCPKDRWNNCFGAFTYDDGNKYVGEWKDSKRHGQGTATYTDGSKYVGQFKYDISHGQGSANLANGDKYVGEFNDGKKHGQGTYYFLANNQWKGDKYVGEWKDDKKHGQGTYNFAAGHKYVGQYKYDRSHGQGSFTFPNGDKYVGEFKDDKKHGQGTLTYANGNKHVGEWKDDKANGQGSYTDHYGDKYVGEWKDDKFNGRGILTFGDGRSAEEGIWEDMQLVRAEKVNLPLVNQQTDAANNQERKKIDADRQALEQERKRLEEDKRQREQANNSNISPDKKQSQISDTRRRLALVIGNAQYKNSPLRNPINDARDISGALAASGFTVSRYENLTYSKMREVVRDFGEKLNRGDVGLFYFSGHAVQYRGKNYLLPTNEDLKHSDEIPTSSLDIDFVLAKMESAKNDLNIVILDACRNNPLGAESRSLDRGLTNVSAAKGTFIAFATSPGNVALDGDGKNSPYTKNLAQAIRKGGMTLEQVFKEVRRNVITETNSQQVPWENSSILGDFYFIK